MAIEGATDANNSANDVNQIVGGPSTSSVPDASLHRADSLNMVNTVDNDTDPSKQADTDPNKGKAPAPGGDPNKSDDDRFDKNPRFQELITTVKDLKASLKEERDARLRTEGELSVLKGLGKTVDKGTKDLPFKDTSGMTEQQMVEWFNDDPKGFYKNILDQAKHELTGTLKGEMSKEDQKKAIDQTYADYEKTNPELAEMWDKGEIQKFIKAHPGHNPISAHMALTLDKKVQAAVDKAVKETTDKVTKEVEEKMTKNFKAKVNARVLGAGPAGGSPPSDEELKDTKNFGGTTRVLADRLAARRAGKLQ